MSVSYHPFAPRPAIDRVKLRRPRFTTAEAVILNTIVNANGQVVTAQRLATVLGVMSTSVYSYICSLRAKLGEPAHAPTMILTSWPAEENEYKTGWYWEGD